MSRKTSKAAWANTFIVALNRPAWVFESDAGQTSKVLSKDTKTCERLVWDASRYIYHLPVGFGPRLSEVLLYLLPICGKWRMQAGAEGFSNITGRSAGSENWERQL